MNIFKNFFAKKVIVSNCTLQKDCCGQMNATVDITTVKYRFFKKTVTRGIYKKANSCMWHWANTKYVVPRDVERLAEEQIALLTFKVDYENAMKGI